MNIRSGLAAVCALALAGCVSDGGYYDDGYADDRYERSYDRGYDRTYDRNDGRTYRTYEQAPAYTDVREYERRESGCFDCGRVERIDRLYGDERTTGAGAVTGAVVGGVVGNQVGSGSGRTAATVAGAVIGGIAGNEIEENRRDGTRYDVHVRMDDGRRLIVSQRELDGIREGSPVRVTDGRAYLH